MKPIAKIAAGSVLLGLFSTSLYAAPLEYVRIGDIDGFGYGGAVGLKGSDGAAADRDSNGLLNAGDLLPDLNENGVLATGSHDDFDNRSASEASGSNVTILGSATVNAIVGSDYTDIALSTSYDNESAAGKIYNANTNSFGAGGTFPGDGNPNTLPNQPGFVFDFTADVADLSVGDDWYFNLVFADYDVDPANIQYTTLGGAKTIVGLTKQNNGPDDGLIQSAYITLGFADIFTDIGGGMYKGYLELDFFAPNEPYTAFDYVELSTTVVQVHTVPAPATFLLFGLGLVGLVTTRRRVKA